MGNKEGFALLKLGVNMGCLIPLLFGDDEQ